MSPLPDSAREGTTGTNPDLHELLSAFPILLRHCLETGCADLRSVPPLYARGAYSGLGWPSVASVCGPGLNRCWVLAVIGKLD